MKLCNLLHDVALEWVEGSLDIDITDVCDDSRAVTPGALFVAIRGLTSDGHAYLSQAAARGAVAAVVEQPVEPSVFPGTVLHVPSTRIALGRIAALFQGEPARKLRLVGITGTNGKTTTSFLVESILTAAGRRPGVVGTVGYRYADRSHAASHTTPGPLELHRMLAEMRDAGCTHVVMEVSSHALAQERVAGVMFRVGAFTNLTQDHLDFHGTMSAYFQAKSRLVRYLLAPPDGIGVIFMDDEYGPRMMSAVVGERLLVSIEQEGADVFPKRWSCTVRGIEAELSSPLGAIAVQSTLIGRHNLANIVVATGIAIALGIDIPSIKGGIATLAGVPGRLERVPNPLGIHVFVDYAHTPDALHHALAALRPLLAQDQESSARLLCVFGCGGDRDPGKRSHMGRIAARDADLVIVTSDNPRTEDPQQIIDHIIAGMTDAPRVELAQLAQAERGFAVEIDRRSAIQAAISAARPGDFVLIAGKGHEDYQVIGTTKHPFDDRAVARTALEARAQ